MAVQDSSYDDRLYNEEVSTYNNMITCEHSLDDLMIIIKDEALKRYSIYITTLPGNLRMLVTILDFAE